jgi:hypothetical protein
MNAMNRDTLARLVPAAFAEHPIENVSKRYTFIPTATVVDLLAREGWLPVMASQARVNKLERQGFQRHMIRFQHQDTKLTRVCDSAAEIVLVNSHDKSTAYQIHAGLFRLVCSNGLVVPDSIFSKVSIRHMGFEQKDVIEASYRVLDQIPRIAESVDNMRSVQLSKDEQTQFAEQALKLRWADNAPVDSRALLSVRRLDDQAMDLWRTFNVVQENLLRGGLSGRSANGRKARTRAVVAIQEQVQVNKELWNLALQFLPGNAVAKVAA